MFESRLVFFVTGIRLNCAEGGSPLFLFDKLFHDLLTKKKVSNERFGYGGQSGKNTKF
jgi:hypothetical protein